MEKVKYKAWIILLLLTFASLLSLKTYSQTFSVNGNVTTYGTSPVRNALVRFIDRNDTLKKFSAITNTSGYCQLSIITNIKKDNPLFPETIELAQNYPNPFNPSTRIQYTVSRTQFITLKIFDVLCIKI